MDVLFYILFNQIQSERPHLNALVRNNGFQELFLRLLAGKETVGLLPHFISFDLNVLTAIFL